VTLLDYRTFVESSEFPQRQQRYAGALQQVVGPFASALPREDQDLYAPWKTVDAIAPYSEPPSAVAPEPTTHPVKTETAEPAEPFDATELETRTKRILLTTGALFTTQTTVHAESARHVTVKGLLFVSADGEHIYDFIFDPEKNEVRDMYRERELLPYPLSLEAFGKWARGGK